MTPRLVALSAAVVLAVGLLAAQTKPAKPLEIYIVDVEGGKADLVVTPSGQTMLVDTGFAPTGTAPNVVTRDVDRIMEVIATAGVTKLDYLLSTHYHVDHVGGVQELVKRIPVTTFLDHGATAEDGVEGRQAEQVRGFQRGLGRLSLFELPGEFFGGLAFAACLRRPAAGADAALRTLGPFSGSRALILIKTR